jgi:hypothetical protein
VLLAWYQVKNLREEAFTRDSSPGNMCQMLDQLEKEETHLR